MLELGRETDHYVAEVKRRNLGGPSWLQGLRRAGLDRFIELGFPTNSWEEWKYTNIRPIPEIPFVQGPYDPSDLSDLSDLTFDDTNAFRLVFINGQLSREHSRVDILPNGVRVELLGSAIESTPDLVERHLGRHAAHTNHPFVALNTAFIEDGAFIHIPRGIVLESPIHLVFLSRPGEKPTISHPRNLIIAEENCQATIVESYTGDPGKYLTNSVTEVIAAANAVVDHYKIQREAEEAFHVGTLQVMLSRSSNFSNTNVALGASIARTDVNVHLDGEGAEATLNGLSIGRGKQLIDNHTKIEHAMPHCPSHELYKGIWDDESEGVFNGRIHVHQDAQKTDAKQTNQHILLSKDATINTKPELEIYADDVRCTHGATIGQLSDDALFYLRARGISLDEARSLLTYAFASDILERIKIEPLRDRLEEHLVALRGVAADVHEIRPESSG